MNEPQLNEPDAETASSSSKAAGPKLRPAYDAGTSEATRELRDTSRRRREAEEKLQQHLLEAKDHIPYHHEHGQHAPAEHEDTER